MSDEDEKIHELYDALGNHPYKDIASREELVLLAVALKDRLDEVEWRYTVALEEVLHLESNLCEVNATSSAEPGHG